MFSGCKLKAGTGSLKGGGFRVKTALQRKKSAQASKKTVVTAMQSQGGGSVTLATRYHQTNTLEHKLYHDSSQSFSWASKGKAGAEVRRRVEQMQVADTRNHTNQQEPPGSNDMLAMTSQNVAVTEYLSAGPTVDQQKSSRFGQHSLHDTSKVNLKIPRRPVTTNAKFQDGINTIQTNFQNKSVSNPSQNIVEASSQTPNEFEQKGVGMLSPDPAQSEKVPSMLTGFKKSQNEDDANQQDDNLDQKSGAEQAQQFNKKSFPGSDSNEGDNQGRP